MDALAAHYGSLGRPADYRRQFEKVSQVAGTDPSIFVIELETLAMKAFGDMSQMACLRLVRDQFIARQDSCALRRHLDSVALETPAWDIVDRCHVWESRADLEVQRGWYPSPRQPLPIYMINNGGMGNVYYSGSLRTVGIIAATFATYASGVTSEGHPNPFRVGNVNTAPDGE